MKCVAQFKVLEYRYETEEEAKFHEQQMRKDGWFVKSGKNIFLGGDKWREYKKRIPEGAFL